MTLSFDVFTREREQKIKGFKRWSRFLVKSI